MTWQLEEFCKRLKEYGLGDFEIRPIYERNYYNPACRVMTGFYMDASGHLRSCSNPRIQYYEVYDNKNGGKYLTYFFYSIDFVNNLLEEQEVFDHDSVKYREVYNYFWHNRFS